MSDWDSDCGDDYTPVQQNIPPPEQNFPSRGNYSVRGQRHGQYSRNFTTTRGRGYLRGNNKVISIPSTKIGRVIGRGGIKIRDLEYESEAKIKIGNSTGDNTDISLFRTDSAIGKAEQMIKDLTIDKEASKKQNAQSVSGTACFSSSITTLTFWVTVCTAAKSRDPTFTYTGLCMYLSASWRTAEGQVEHIGVQVSHPKTNIDLRFKAKKSTASDVTADLACKGFYCESLHGDRDQSDREAALEDMMDGTVNILVATDVASRGIDIKDLTHVINLDFPRKIEEYVHRIGRTGRAGKTGIALSLVTKDDWANAGELIKILKEAHQEVPSELREMADRFKANKSTRQHG